MPKIFAQLVSTILNPLVLLVPIPYLLVLKATGSFEYAIHWTFISLIFLFLFSSFILGGISLGYFSDLDISKRKERPFLYSAAILFSVIFLGLLVALGAPRLLFIAIIGLLLGLSINEIVNKFTKTSIHVAAITSFVTVLVYVYGLQYSFFYLLVPLVAWARIKTKNHTLFQTILGAGTSIFLTIFIYIMFRYIIK